MTKEMLFNSLRSLGFKGTTVAEACEFCEDISNKYWVDAPVSVQTNEMKISAALSKLFKTYIKVLKII